MYVNSFKSATKIISRCLKIIYVFSPIILAHLNHFKNLHNTSGLVGLNEQMPDAREIQIVKNVIQTNCCLKSFFAKSGETWSQSRKIP